MSESCIVVKKIFLESIMEFIRYAKSPEEVHEYIEMLKKEVRRYPEDSIGVDDAKIIIKRVNEKFTIKNMRRSVAS